MDTENKGKQCRRPKGVTHPFFREAANMDWAPAVLCGSFWEGATSADSLLCLYTRPSSKSFFLPHDFASLSLFRDLLKHLP